MAPTPLSRTWNKSLVSAAAIVVTIILFVALQHEAATKNVIGVGGLVDGDSTFDAGPSSKSPQRPLATEHTTPAKRKAIITSVQRKDETTADWLAELLPDWETSVYVTDRRSDEEASFGSSLISPQSLPVNRGREASVYLTYIIHHYYDLPDYMVFIHGKRYQIHNGMCLSYNAGMQMTSANIKDR